MSSDFGVDPSKKSSSCCICCKAFTKGAPKGSAKHRVILSTRKASSRFGRLSLFNMRESKLGDFEKCSVSRFTSIEVLKRADGSDMNIGMNKHISNIYL